MARRVPIGVLLAAAAIFAPTVVYAAATPVLIQPLRSAQVQAAFPADCTKFTPDKTPASQLQLLDCKLSEVINSLPGFSATTDPASAATLELHARLNDNADTLAVNVIDRQTDAVVGTVPIPVTLDKSGNQQLSSQAAQLLTAALQTKAQPSLAVPGAGIISAPVDKLYPAPAKVADDFSKVLFVAIDGYDPAAMNIDTQVAYAYNSFRRIYAAHRILALPIAEPANLQSVKDFCGGPLGAVPILHVTMSKDSRANPFLDAIYTGVQFDGVVKECGADKASFVARDANYAGNYRSTYYRNFVAGIQAGAAYSTSPFITKYKTWLLFPLAFLGSFAHETQSYNGTVYCAAVDLVNKHLLDLRTDAKAAESKLATTPTPNCKGSGIFGVAPLNI